MADADRQSERSSEKVTDNVKSAGERSSSHDKKGERSSHDSSKKGKQPVKTTQSAIAVSEDKLLDAIGSLQEAITKQTSTMGEQDKRLGEQSRQLQELSERMTSFEAVKEPLDYCYMYDQYEEEYFEETEKTHSPEEAATGP